MLFPIELENIVSESTKKRYITKSIVEEIAG
jgi:hypothetical protein